MYAEVTLILIQFFYKNMVITVSMHMCIITVCNYILQIITLLI